MQVDVYWLRFGSFSRPPHSSFKDHGFVTVTVVISNEEFVFVVKIWLLLLGVENALLLDSDTRRAVNLASVRDAEAQGSRG